MQFGTKVKLKVESENDIYSIQLPLQGSVGEIIEIFRFNLYWKNYSILK